MDERIPSQLGPFPAAVAVHGVIAALDGPDRRLGADAVLELDQEPFGGPGRRVPAVGEGMQDDAVRRQPEPMSDLHESLDVLVDCVDASRTDEAQDVQARAVIEGVCARRRQRRVGIEGPVRDRLGDPREVLEHAEPGPEVQVPDLGVAHLAHRQPNRRARRLEPGVGPVRHESAPGRHVGSEQRVPPRIVVQPKAVEDAEHDRLGRRPAPSGGQPWSSAAQATIRPNPTASREAPPTSAPSMSGWAKNSRALSGVTLPP